MDDLERTNCWKPRTISTLIIHWLDADWWETKSGGSGQLKIVLFFFGELCGCWPNRTLSFRSGRTARRRRPGRASGSRQERHAHQLAAAAHSPTRRRQRQRRCAPSPLAFHRCSRIRLYHPRIHHPAAYIGHFRLEPNFYMIKPSGCIIQPSGYIGHFERCEREHLRA